MSHHFAAEKALIEASLRYVKANDQYGVLVYDNVMVSAEMRAKVTEEFKAALDAFVEAAHAVIVQREATNGR